MACDLPFRLAQSAQDQAFRLVYYSKLASTNGEALALARGGDEGRLWIVARTQTAGRGRNGREWSSPPGNLYASLLLVDPSPPRESAELGFVAGVAAAHALREILRGDPRVKIKWPNDILYDGAKLCGILLESTSFPCGRFACAAGIGVNCRTHPKNTPYPATDLMTVKNFPVEPEAVFYELSASMAHWIGVWAGGTGFASVRSAWLALAAGIGAQISVALPSQTVQGTFQTIDAAGRLLIAQEGGTLAVEAGDIVFAQQPAASTAKAAG
jgi:BirA family transcriptional regulator, biotin operon repressor / biotin---[acetyl-CoA-carboxylase] ligase